MWLDCRTWWRPVRTTSCLRLMTADGAYAAAIMAELPTMVQWLFEPTTIHAATPPTSWTLMAIVSNSFIRVGNMRIHSRRMTGEYPCSRLAPRRRSPFSCPFCSSERVRHEVVYDGRAVSSIDSNTDFRQRYRVRNFTGNY
jgi:hypothetical protein